MRILYFTPFPASLPTAAALQHDLNKDRVFHDMQILDGAQRFGFDDWEELITHGYRYGSEFDAVLVGVPVNAAKEDKKFFDSMRRYCDRSHSKPVVALLGVTPDKAQVADEFSALAARATFAHDMRKDIRLLAEYLARAVIMPPPNVVKPFELADFTLDYKSGRVSVGGQEPHLTGSEYTLLSLLTRNANVVLTKERIMDVLYERMDEPDIKIIDVMISKLRKKLSVSEIDDFGARLIRTVWGRGYRAAGTIDHLLEPLVPYTQNNEFDSGTPLNLGGVMFIKDARRAGVRLWFEDYSKALTPLQSRLMLLTDVETQVALRASHYWTYLDTGYEAARGVERGEENMANRQLEAQIRKLNAILGRREGCKHLQIHRTMVGGSMYFWRGPEKPADLALKRGRFTTAPRSSTPIVRSA